MKLARPCLACSSCPRNVRTRWLLEAGWEFLGNSRRATARCHGFSRGVTIEQGTVGQITTSVRWKEALVVPVGELRPGLSYNCGHATFSFVLCTSSGSNAHWTHREGHDDCVSRLPGTSPLPKLLLLHFIFLTTVGSGPGRWCSPV